VRVIPSKEINDLLRITPNFERYPEEREKPVPMQLHEHHLFTLLGGNPQSIILTAPLLADFENDLQLPQLYEMLTSNNLS
jgi:hypothetical protein